MTTTDATAIDPIVDEVRARYADVARAVLDRVAADAGGHRELLRPDR